MPRILAIAGSLRAASFNKALLHALADLAPEGCEVDVATPQGIPLYNGDVEAAEGPPPAVVTLKEKLGQSDGVILATPEYNGSFPGVLKNTIDWLSRPAKDNGSYFGNRPFAVVGATPSGGGTRAAQAAWLPVLRALGVKMWFGGVLYVAAAHQVFEDGNLADDALRERAQRFIEGFTLFAGS